MNLFQGYTFNCYFILTHFFTTLLQSMWTLTFNLSYMDETPSSEANLIPHVFTTGHLKSLSPSQIKIHFRKITYNNFLVKFLVSTTQVLNPLLSEGQVGTILSIDQELFLPGYEYLTQLYGAARNGNGLPQLIEKRSMYFGQLLGNVNNN